MNSIHIQTQDMKNKEKALEYIKEMVELYSLVKTQKEFCAMKEHILKEGKKMKKDLKEPTKIKVDFNKFKDKNFLEDFGNHLKEVLGAVNQIDVSKVWVNPSTYDKFQENVLKQLSLKEGKQKAQRVVGWVCLQYAPACDYENRFGLEDGFIYVEQDFEVAPRD